MQQAAQAQEAGHYVEAEPFKGAGATPWFDALFDTCERLGMALELERYPERENQDGIAVTSLFVINVTLDGNLKAQWRSTRIDEAAEHVCQKLGIELAETA